MSDARHLTIVGGGFSGTLLAINLLRHEGPRATLIERDPGRLGRGVAYSARQPTHLLNVRAANMSALPDHPDHFVRWLERNGLGDAASFASRAVYGRYLNDLLAEAGARFPGRLTILEGEAVGLEERPDGVAIRLADQTELGADLAVLAPGNLPPHVPAEIARAGLDWDRFVADPWGSDPAEGLTGIDTVLLLGTGLTAVDAALALEASGFEGRIVALSRRGLLPRVHAVVGASAKLTERPPSRTVALLRSVRERARQQDWRLAIDELRPHTRGIWRAASMKERRRFLRHLRPWWDVHRHRLAPDVAARVDALREAGRLEVLAGKLVEVEPRGEGVSIRWRPRGEHAVQEMTVRRIVNCTGPAGDFARSGDPLLASLAEAGLIRPDPLHLGIDVDARQRAIDVDGRHHARLRVIGPMTRGGDWEMTAVPDLRRQAWDLARLLANAHWVGGEGL